jgi:hypothetical protein
MSEELRYYWVPLDISHNPLWPFAVPSNFEQPEPPGVFVVGWLKTASVPTDVRAKWKRSEGGVSDRETTSCCASPRVTATDSMGCRLSQYYRAG